MIRKSPKDEPSISKFERVTAIFVSQVVVKSQIHIVFKYPNPLTFWDLDQFFSHVKSIYNSERIHKVSRSNNNLEPLIKSGHFRDKSLSTWSVTKLSYYSLKRVIFPLQQFKSPKRLFKRLRNVQAYVQSIHITGTGDS